ncbi:MAG: acetylglutamate kinase [Pseudomonadota bacterium]
MADRSFQDRVELLLKGLEEGREVRAYLRRFRERGQGCFAVIKVGGAIVDSDLETLAEALSLLHAMGLPPIVVYGAGPQLNERLADLGVTEERRDGLRVTPESVMPTVAAAAAQMGHRLIDAMQRRGAAAVSVHPGTVAVHVLDKDRYGMVGDVEAVDADALVSLLSTGMVPLISCVHADATGQLLNINADNVARAVAEALTPQKVVFVTSTGGILNESNEIVSSINLATERDEIFAAPWLQGGMRHKLGEIADLLDRLPLASSVSMTSVSGLIRELFTHSGSGTLIRRGEAIVSQASPRREDFEGLIETAFKKTLKADYWETFSPRYALLSEQKRAGAVVSSVAGVDFLDKFAVLSSARGEGLAKTLWHALVDASPQLVWRSRRENPFNGFYHAQADGSVQRGPWTVYWVGRPLEARISALADDIAAVPGHFEGET